MNVSLKNKDAVSGVVKLEIVKADYAEQLEMNLRNFRQKANVPGFRKGMVPIGMVKKMFGKQLMAEEVNKLVSEALLGYIRENEIAILGEPMPNTTEQQPIDFDKQEDFEFYFDIALAPQFDAELSKNDVIPYYQVAVDETMLNDQLASYAAHFGSMEQAQDVEADDMVKGVVAELENGMPKEGGLVVNAGVMMPAYMKNEDEKAKFIGAKQDSIVVFNPRIAYEGAEAELASLLGVKKEEVDNYTGDFSFEIKEIVRRQKAEVNQELFDKVFGEGVVTSEEEFKEKIKEAYAEQFEPQVSFKFLSDVRELLAGRVGELAIAEDLMKRWLVAASEKNTPESIEADFPAIKEDLKYHLIKSSLVKKNGLKVEQADVFEFAKRLSKMQLAQYGMLSVPDNILENYAKEMLSNQTTWQNVFDRAQEEKLSACLKEQVTLDIKTVSPGELNALFE